MAIKGKPLNAKNTARLAELREKKQREEIADGGLEHNNSNMLNSARKLKTERQKGLFELLTGQSIGSVGKMRRKLKLKISGRHLI